MMGVERRMSGVLHMHALKAAAYVVLQREGGAAAEETVSGWWQQAGEDPSREQW